MLMGKYNNSIDAKNRMIVPSKCRDDLGYKCVLTKGDDLCLYIYPMCEWDKVREKLAALPTSDKLIRAYVRKVYSNAVECEVDKPGRLTIPTELREYAGIDKDIVTVGMIDKLEIWSAAQWKDNESTENEETDAAKLEELLRQYGI